MVVSFDPEEAEHIAPGRLSAAEEDKRAKQHQGLADPFRHRGEENRRVRKSQMGLPRIDGEIEGAGISSLRKEIEGNGKRAAMSKMKRRRRIPAFFFPENWRDG
jgi:hypothetical protein